MNRDHENERKRGLISTRSFATALTVAVVLLAGCSGLIGSDDGLGAGGEPMDDIPEDVDGVMHFSSGIMTDQTTEQLVDGFIEIGSEQDPAYDGPESYDELLAEFEDESDLDIDGFHSATVFFKGEMNGADEYTGAIMQTDWTVEEIFDAADEEMDDIETDEYSGVTIYIEDDELGETTWLADLGDGVYAVGTEQVVRDVIDTRQGEIDAWSGELRDIYENTEDGYIKVAVDLTEELGDVEQPGAGFFPDASNVGAISMVYHTAGNDMKMDTHIHMDTAENAEQIKETIDFGLMFVEGELQEENPELADFLDGLDVEQDGSEIAIRFTTTPDEILDLIEEFADETGFEDVDDPLAVQPVGATELAG